MKNHNKFSYTAENNLDHESWGPFADEVGNVPPAEVPKSSRGSDPIAETRRRLEAGDALVGVHNVYDTMDLVDGVVDDVTRQAADADVHAGMLLSAAKGYDADNPFISPDEKARRDKESADQSRFNSAVLAYTQKYSRQGERPKDDIRAQQEYDRIAMDIHRAAVEAVHNGWVPEEQRRKKRKSGRIRKFFGLSK